MANFEDLHNRRTRHNPSLRIKIPMFSKFSLISVIWLLQAIFFIGFLNACQTIQKMTQGGKWRLIKLAKILKLQKEWYMKYFMSLKLFSLWPRYEYKHTAILDLPTYPTNILKYPLFRLEKTRLFGTDLKIWLRFWRFFEALPSFGI